MKDVNLYNVGNAASEVINLTKSVLAHFVNAPGILTLIDEHVDIVENVILEKALYHNKFDSDVKRILEKLQYHGVSLNITTGLNGNSKLLIYI